MVEVAVGARTPKLAKFEIRGEIGHGGMATVYRALDVRLGRDVALKVIHPHLRNSPEVAARFHVEAKAVAKLRHPNIVEVYDIGGADESEQYLVVELVRGTTLRCLLQEGGPMPAEIAAAVAVSLLDALSHAHASGVVHRDLKPENVLIAHRKLSDHSDERLDAGPQAAVKLTDFGIAKILDVQGVTSTGQVLGSPAHMAPEQIEGGEVDGRSDVFGLGVLLYECMVGHLPFQGNNPAQVLRRVLDGTYSPARVEQPRVGDRWSAIIDRALAHDRSARFESAQAMRGAVVDELSRLGFWPAGDELESFLGDPSSFVATYTPRIVERLCDQADEARKQGDALGAAGDYNRALANAPDDPRLLRIVAHMRRTEARKRWLRRWGLRAAAVAITGVAVAGAAHLVVRTRAEHVATKGPVSLAIERSPTSGQVPSPRPVVPSTPVASHESVAPPVAHAVALKPVERHLTLDLAPPMGVSVSVDRQSPLSVSTGDALTLDSHPHALTFSCSVCASIQIAVQTGDHDDTLIVSVPIKPAILVVDGEVDRTYQVTEHPEIVIRAGTSTIPLKSAFEHVTVKQIETGAAVPVRLEAGKSVRVQF